MGEPNLYNNFINFQKSSINLTFKSNAVSTLHKSGLEFNKKGTPQWIERR